MENDNFLDDNDTPTFDRYKRYYSENGLWNKIKKHYKNVNKKLIKLGITLFYTLRDDDTPKWAKTIILGALGYFILPIDLIPDFVPITGFTDDFAAIIVALGSVVLHIKDEHKEKANAILEKFF